MISLFMLGGIEIAAIVFIILFLFGGRKIPQLMRGLGQGIKEFTLARREIDNAIDETRQSAKRIEREIKHET